MTTLVKLASDACDVYRGVSKIASKKRNDYADFVSAVQQQNKRNKFETYGGDLSSVHPQLRGFYAEHNPVNAYVDSNDTDIWLAPVNALKGLQSEYSYGKPGFVFATNNGDPIFITNKGVFTFPHGVPDITEKDHERLANNFVDYMQKLKGGMAPVKTAGLRLQG